MPWTSRTTLDGKGDDVMPSGWEDRGGTKWRICVVSRRAPSAGLGPPLRRACVRVESDSMHGLATDAESGRNCPNAAISYS